MAQQSGQGDAQAPQRDSETSGAAEKGQARDNQEKELEAEQESAAAMDADVPQPPDSDKTTEGQPS
ncbi:MAG TPA: hypothetical protein VF708_20420 [Pyrinomonadaceae bacterium]|jgi:uncharacterized protein (DUF3084 family)